MTSSLVAPDVSIKMGNYKFLSSPIVLGDSDIDLILGMDWLSKHKAQLDCAAREIQLTHSSEDVIILPLVMKPFGFSLSMRRANWMPSLKFQSFASIKMSFQKSFRVCPRTVQLSSLSN